jgi:SAM-dependent methyltransferase
VVGHIEERLCPSILSSDLTALPPFRFREQPVAAVAAAEAGLKAGPSAEGRSSSAGDTSKLGCWQRPEPGCERVVDGALVGRLVARLGAAAGPSPAVLDIGCGAGLETRRLLDLVPTCRVSALDSTATAQAAVAKTQLALDTLGALPGVTVVDHTLPAPLPFAARAFDVAFARLSLHYFREEELREHIVPELRRVLRVGGTLVVVIKTADGATPGAFTAACGNRKVHLGVPTWHGLLQGAGMTLTCSTAMMPGHRHEDWEAAGAPWVIEAVEPPVS